MAPKKNRPQGSATNEWTVRLAKTHFDQVLLRARNEGPQFIGPRGERQLVVMSMREFEQLQRSKLRRGSLAEFFANSPLAGADLNLKRASDVGRKTDL